MIEIDRDAWKRSMHAAKVKDAQTRLEQAATALVVSVIFSAGFMFFVVFGPAIVAFLGTYGWQTGVGTLALCGLAIVIRLALDVRIVWKAHQAKKAG